MPQTMQLTVLIRPFFEQVFALYCQDIMLIQKSAGIDLAFYLTTLSLHDSGSSSSEWGGILVGCFFVYVFICPRFSQYHLVARSQISFVRISFIPRILKDWRHSHFCGDSLMLKRCRVKPGDHQLTIWRSSETSVGGLASSQGSNFCVHFLLVWFLSSVYG